jgi:PAS domain S-box-containing protein
MTQPARIPEDESTRLARLHALAVLDTPPETLFDAITHAASIVCGMPIALVSLVDSERQWFKSNVGLPGATETARNIAFCAHVILGPDLMEVEDATLDPRFASNPLVTGDAGIRFYAGSPITLSDGARVGTLCVIDQAPRQLTGVQRDALNYLATAVAQALEIRERAIRALASLSESESRYRTLVEYQTEMVSLADRDGTLTFVNEAYARQFGNSAAAMVGTSLYEYVAPEDRDTVRNYLSALWDSAGTAHDENHMLSADGSGPRWVAWTNRALCDPSGAVVAIHSVGRDITEEKTLASQLNAKAREIEDLYNNAPCGYHSVGASGNYIKINATELEWLGVSRAEVLGKLSPWDFFGPEDRELITAGFSAAKATGSTQRLSCRLLGRHGVQRDVSLNMSVVLDEDGTFLMTRSVMFDITAQKDAERAVQRLNAEQRTILESELFGIAKLRDRRFTWVNAGLARALGYLPGELVGLPARVCHVDEATHQRYGVAAYQTMSNGKTYRDELPMRRKDGSLIWVELAGTLLDAATGESLWQLSDISSRKAAELALSSNRALLERTGAMAGVGGWELDLATGELLWTAETCRIHGMPVDFKPNAALAIEFYLPADRPVIQAAVDAALNGGPGYDLELQLQRVDGTRIWVRTVGAIKFDEGKPSKLVGAIQDITEKVAKLRRIEHLFDVAEAQRRELKGHRDRAEAEEEVANFLLSRLSRIEHLDATGVQYCWQPAESFSGDIIAVAKSSSGDTYGMLADATGHGLAAAINLIPLTSAFYALAAKGFNLLSISLELNKVVKDYSLADRFVAVTLTRFIQREQLLEVVNAGNPAALLLDADLATQREFRSGSIPLGIVDQSLFRPIVETIELRGNETLLMFSDGLIEATNFDGTAFGSVGVNAAVASAGSAGKLVAAIRESMAAHVAGHPFADDVSVLALAAADAISDHRTQAERDARVQSPQDQSLASGQDSGGESQGCWSLALRFSAFELKKMEVVPLVVTLARNFGLHGPVESVVFTVISELFQNALEHGLLQLDSRIKAEPEGFERYLDLRAKRLAALSHGEIAISMDHIAAGSEGGHLEISVRDTGPGFDHEAQIRQLDLNGAAGASALPSGRGLAMLRKLCQSVSFNQEGNEGKVGLAYCLPAESMQ